MAQSGTVISRLAQVAGVRPAWIRSRVERLRSVGAVPNGKRGEDLENGQYDLAQINNVLFSAAAAPDDAVEAVQMLRNLWYRPKPGNASPYIEGAFTLGDALDLLVQGVAQGLAGAKTGFGEKWAPSAVDLTVVNRAAGVFRWELDDCDFERADRYGPRPGDIACLRAGGLAPAITILPPVIMAAAELWLDALERQHRLDALIRPLKRETAVPSAKETVAVNTSAKRTSSARKLSGE